MSDPSHNQAPPPAGSSSSIHTGGGDAAGRDLDKRQGLFVEHGTVVVQAPPLPPDAPRSLMLAKVRSIWIAGVLEKSLYGLVQLQPGLRSDPRKVDLPIRALVQEAGGPAEDLPNGTPIASVFDRFGGALLILGAPGAGKTTLLLELCRALLDRAAADPALPMPVVFPLSTWAAERKPLAEWLVDQLVTLYQMRRKDAAAWVAQDLVLPLLDGLDEVAEAHRPACVAAINAFRAERGTLPLVVCSRLQEYETVAEKAAQLRLHGAVIVQTLRRAGVLDALGALGPEAAGLRDFLAAHERDWLWSVATSPLGLSVLVPAVQHDPALLQAGGSDAERRDRIFGAYVDAMFERRAVEGRWSREETIRLLSWLAAQMQRRGQTLFFLIALQPDWLPWPWQRGLVRLGLLLCSSMACGLVGGLILWFAGGLTGTLLSGLGGGLAGGVVGGLLSWRMGGEVRKLPRATFKQAVEKHANKVTDTAVTFSPEQVRGFLGSAVGELTGGMSGGLAGGLAGGLTGGMLRGQTGALAGLLTGTLVGTVIGIVVGAVAGRRRVSTYREHLFLLSIVLVLSGRAILQSYLVRLLLARAGLTPLRYAAFLDHAADRVLLRRVGGGWVFVHRLLLDYFAGLAPGVGVGSEGEEEKGG